MLVGWLLLGFSVKNSGADFLGSRLWTKSSKFYPEQEKGAAPVVFLLQTQPERMLIHHLAAFIGSFLETSSHVILDVGGPCIIFGFFLLYGRLNQLNTHI